MKLQTFFLSVLFCVTVASAFADAGVALKTDTVRQEPFQDAKPVFTINKGDSVEILARSGGWLKIQHPSGTGWARMLSFKRGGTTQKNTHDGNDLLKLASGRAGTGQVVSTTGIRGLSEEELKTAKFNPEQLRQAESYAASQADARAYAAKGKLVSRPFAYLPESTR